MSEKELASGPTNEVIRLADERYGSAGSGDLGCEFVEM